MTKDLTEFIKDAKAKRDEYQQKGLELESKSFDEVENQTKSKQLAYKAGKAFGKSEAYAAVVNDLEKLVFGINLD